MNGLPASHAAAPVRPRKKAAAPNKTVGSVASAVKILRYLSRNDGSAGVTQIARDTQVNTSTCFNILRTLAAEDLVRFDAQSKSYALSLGIMEIANGATAFGADIGAIRPQIEELARKHKVTLTVWQPAGGNRKVLIMAAVTRSAIRIQMAVGQRLPMLIGAGGRCFAAFSQLSRKEQRRRFDEIRWDQPLSFAEFQQQVARTARDGWSLDAGNFAVGTISIAVPVLNSERIAVMALSATMFAGQYRRKAALELVKDIQALAQQLARAAGEV